MTFATVTSIAIDIDIDSVGRCVIQREMRACEVIFGCVVNMVLWFFMVESWPSLSHRSLSPRREL